MSFREDIKKGFTLAEVLITLVIIGVVAALVIPQVNITYQRAALYAQFLKVYNTLSKTVMISSMANSEVAAWNLDVNNPDIIMSNYLKNYMHVISESTVHPYTIRDLDLKVLGALNNYVSGNTGGGTIQYTNADGSSMLVWEIREAGPVIMIDTNGDKTPNIIGRDIHLFLLQKSDGEVVPSAKAGVNNANCGGTPESGVLAGEGCGSRMIKEGKMDF